MSLISLEEFKCGISENSIYEVDVNSLISDSIISPIHIYFEASNIKIRTIFPEFVYLSDNKCNIYLSQIEEIHKTTNENNQTVYQFHCGKDEKEKKIVKIVEFL